MLQIQKIRTSQSEVITALAKRGIAAEDMIQQILDTDEKRREVQTTHDQLSAEANAINKEIGQLFQSGKKEEATELRNRGSELKIKTKELHEEQERLEKLLEEQLLQLPNTPHESVPAGKDAEDNEEVRSSGTIPTFTFDPLPHWDLASKYNLIDFELGVKISGAGFPVYRNQGARLQRALINFFLDENTAAGYEEVQPPHLVNSASGYGTGQLPDKEGQMYHTALDDLYLIPTAEVPVTNIFRDEVLRKDELPVKCTAYTPCFRREAGSYGRDVRGLNRLHQFDKVEIVQVADPERSYQILEEMVSHVAGILDKLELPYRILRLCGGDMGFTSALTYDFEVYSAAQERWLEVSSVSNFETFQANRLKLRYKSEGEPTQLCHTLNGSAMALPRIVAALLENNQDEQGIRIPKALQAYTGFNRIES
jgi:seryl-tRNA synthetase